MAAAVATVCKCAESSQRAAEHIGYHLNAFIPAASANTGVQESVLFVGSEPSHTGDLLPFHVESSQECLRGPGGHSSQTFSSSGDGKHATLAASNICRINLEGSLKTFGHHFTKQLTYRLNLVGVSACALSTIVALLPHGVPTVYPC